MLFDKLKKYARQTIAPLHMPGHKRNTNLLGSDLPYEIDITEIDGFDDLHSMTGVLKGHRRRGRAAVWLPSRVFRL